MRKLLIAPFLGLIYLYKYVISPVLPRGCRHFPSCSTYAADALKKYGPIVGSYMAANRIARCNPWGTHGYDPVPGFIIKKINLKKFGEKSHQHYPRCNRLMPH